MDFKTHLIESIGEKEAELLIDSLSRKSQHAVLLNVSKISDEDFLKEFPLVTPHPYVKHAYIYDKEIYELGKHLYHELGFYYLQEPSAMVVSSLIDFEDDDYVLDMCAAPGGKTIQASLKMHGNGLIIANDLSFSRCGLLSNNVERIGLGNIIITNGDMTDTYQKPHNAFDKIILDAPCSGSGMFRKHELMESDWSINKVLRFQAIQKDLILIAYKMLKPGGLLSYSTCSYSKEEDEDVINYLLDKTDAIVKEIKGIDAGYINPKSPIGIRLMPSHFSGEGQYICHIQKPGEKKKTEYIHDNKFKDIVPLDYDVKKVNNYLFAIKNGKEIKGFNIYRYGIKVGEYKKDRFIYDIHFARSLNNNQFPNIDLSLEETKSYLQGNQINKISNKKGFILLTYKNKAIDIAKTDGKVIKNNYPKGLRKSF